MTDLIISLVLSVFVTIGIKLWFADSGLDAFPVLTFLVITIVSYMATAGVHSLLHVL